MTVVGDSGTADTVPPPLALPASSPFGPPEHERGWVAVATEMAAVFAQRAADLDETAELPAENLRQLHETGLDIAMLPAAHGGEDMSFRTFGQVLRIVSRACPSTGCLWLMHIGAVTGLVTRGDADTARYYAAELAAGKRFANALSEPTSGNMFLVPLQAAVPVEGGFRLDGAKRFVSGCEAADHFLVNALVDGVPTFFGVERDDTIGFVPIWDTVGMRATRSQLVSFDGTVLRADRRCQPPAAGETNPIAVGLAFLSIGVAEAAFDALVDHARSRVIPSTGASLSHMQWVQFDAAEMHVRLQAATLLAERSLWLADLGSPDTYTAAFEAKLFANQVAKDVAELGVRVGGASGYLRTSPIQRHFRDAQAGALMAYSVEVCRDVVGKRVLGVG
ncbi:acyl-CoA dehydrogenase family protein [Frankia sp. CiP3]|uniref:acyl-CoA dehydrogenase family protein n=1 Tax=Frankia sp. CiP3 TaxID=2880971 RepID=UPI001EF417E4|nr:acyl-CoA dehydrogenase family protein [Frankia sp. CiP3]